jgi:hypothetical protein
VLTSIAVIESFNFTIGNVDESANVVIKEDDAASSSSSLSSSSSSNRLSNISDLSTSEYNALMGRLPPLPGSSSTTDVVSFSSRSPTLIKQENIDVVSTPFPPPVSHRSEEVIDADWVAAAVETETATEVLKILRFSPAEGQNEDSVSKITITFNQPMIEMMMMMMGHREDILKQKNGN